jgi:hypothetical protein
MEILQIFKKVGEYLSSYVGKGVNLLISKGIFTSSITIKVFTILLIFLLSAIALKVLKVTSTTIKYAIIAVAILLGASVGLSLI